MHRRKKTAQKFTLHSLNKSKSTIDYAFLVALISAGGYLLAYDFELAYAGYFSIPAQFVEVNLRSIVVLACVLLSFFSAAIGILDIFSIGWSHKKWLPPNEGMLLLLPMILVMTMFFFGEDSILMWSLAIGLIFVVIGLVAVLRWVDGNSYTTASTQRRNTGFADLFFWKIRESVGRTIFAVLAVLLLLHFMILPYAGKLAAKRDIAFPVIEDLNLVILRVYGNQVISAPLDAKSKSVCPEFRIFTLSSLEEFRIRLKSIGPLKVTSKCAREDEPGTQHTVDSTAVRK